MWAKNLRLSLEVIFHFWMQMKLTIQAQLRKSTEAGGQKNKSFGSFMGLG